MRWSFIVDGMMTKIGQLVPGVAALSPEESAEFRARWWMVFLPGIPPDWNVRDAAISMSEYVSVPRASKAEVRYSRQVGGSFYLMSEPQVPVFRFSSDAPPNLGGLSSLIWGPGGTPWVDGCVVCDAALSWSLVVAHDGPFFLTRRNSGDDSAD